MRWITVGVPILLIVQSLLPSAGRRVAALHPVNAFLILGLLACGSWVLWHSNVAVESGEAELKAEQRSAVEPV